MPGTPRSGRTVRDLRRDNRAEVLRHLYFGGATSRLEMARVTGLSPATVTNVVSELLADGVVREVGQLSSEGGRPAVLVAVNPAHRGVVGVDIGETAVVAEVFDLTLGMLARVEVPRATADADPERLAALAGEAVAAARQQAGIEQSTIIGAGVGVPGVAVMANEETIVYLPGGSAPVGLRSLLGATLGMPVLVDNGAKTMGRAEAWFGAGTGARHLVVALIGTGVGAAIVTDGQVFGGSTNGAGEWGHTTVVIDGSRCRCGALGCLEAYVGAPGILARWAAAGHPVEPGEDENAGLAAFVRALDAGDPTAGPVLAETARYLAVATGNLANLINPELIVIGGWAGLMLADHLIRRWRLRWGATRSHRSPPP